MSLRAPEDSMPDCTVDFDKVVPNNEAMPLVISMDYKILYLVSLL